MVLLIIKINKPNLFFLILTGNTIKGIITTIVFSTEELSNQTRSTHSPVQHLSMWKSIMIPSSKTEGYIQYVCARDAKNRKTSVGYEYNKETVQELLHYLLCCEEYSHQLPCQVVLKKLNPHEWISVLCDLVWGTLSYIPYAEKLHFHEDYLREIMHFGLAIFKPTNFSLTLEVTSIIALIS